MLELSLQQGDEPFDDTKLLTRRNRWPTCKSPDFCQSSARELRLQQEDGPDGVRQLALQALMSLGGSYPQAKCQPAVEPVNQPN